MNFESLVNNRDEFYSVARNDVCQQMCVAYGLLSFKIFIPILYFDIH